MPIMLHGYGETGHLIPHMEVWISHPISVISIRDMRYRISCISKGILDIPNSIPNHMYPYGGIGYPISTITIWGTVCLVSAMSMEDRGYQLSCITRGIWDMGRMGYPTSHPNDYWPFNTSHVHSGILYTQYPPWRFGISDIQYHSCPWFLPNLIISQFRIHQIMGFRTSRLDSY